MKSIAGRLSVVFVLVFIASLVIAAALYESHRQLATGIVDHTFWLLVAAAFLRLVSLTRKGSREGPS